MAVIKWLFVVIFGVAAVGAFGFAFMDGAATRTTTPRSAPVIALREFPSGATLAAVAAPPPQDRAPTEAVVEKPEPTPVPVVEKPAPVVAKPVPAPVVAKPAPVAEDPAPVAEKPPEPVAEKPAPRPAPVPAAPPAEGLLNLRASDTADVYLDGKKLGGSPLLGVKARAGNHKVRFDCYDGAGNTMPGAAQTVVVKADSETDIEFACPTE